MKPNVRAGTAANTCGECQLCCRLVPVATLQKPAGTTCRYQRFHVGCTVYHQPEMPEECGAWTCQWLAGDLEGLERPDRSRYVVDVMPDFITVVDDRSGERRDIPVVQIWVDPAYPDAHRDPGLRRLMVQWAKGGVAAIVRYSSTDAMAIFAPPFDAKRRWREVSMLQRVEEHSAREVLQVLGYPTRRTQSDKT